MAQRVAITVDLGAGAPIEVVRQVIDNLDTVCQFGGELQYRAAIAQAELAILRRPTAYISGQVYDDFIFSVDPSFRHGPRGFGATLPAALLAPAISRYLEENDVARETITTVESIRYSNPIEIVIGAGLVTLVVVLRTIRDWPARRRLNAAVATDIENEVLARKELREEFNRRVIQNGIPLAAPQIDDLFSLDVVRAMQALGDSNFSLRELASPREDDEFGDEAPVAP